jgi:hypothetical protein
MIQLQLDSPQAQNSGFFTAQLWPLMAVVSIATPQHLNDQHTGIANVSSYKSAHSHVHSIFGLSMPSQAGRALQVMPASTKM